MHLHRVKLLRIVADARLREDVLRLLERVGAQGYTVSAAVGSGAHGERTGLNPETANVLIEMIASEERAEEAMKLVHRELLGPNAVIAYLMDAQVLRREKFL